MTDAPHMPVLLNEVITAMDVQDRRSYVDATLGAGGYVRAIINAADCTVFGFDRDPNAIELAKNRIALANDKVKLINRPFAELYEVLEELGISGVDGVVFDLGVSSMQIDEAERGFSFRFDGPLSMRMDQGKPDAADVVNVAEVGDLAAIFKFYGEERHAKRIARAIVQTRQDAPILSTGQLADIVAKVAPKRPQDKIHPATRVFQALRIFVNDELGQLVQGLLASEKILNPSGRLVVVTFHSLEDRIAKRFFADRCGTAGTSSRHTPPTKETEPTFTHLAKKAQTSTSDEIEVNPRARSAKLRAGIRTIQLPRADCDAFAHVAPSLSNALQQWSI